MVEIAIELSGPAPAPDGITVQFETLGSPARAGEDYVSPTPFAKNHTATIAAG